MTSRKREAALFALPDRQERQKARKKGPLFRKEGQTGNALAKTLKNWYNSAVKLRSCQTKEALRRERLTGGLLGGGLALAWVGLCFAPGLTLDFSDLFSLSMGLTVLLLGALALFLGKEGFLRIWAFACRGRETSVGRVIVIPSARAALLVSYAAFSALLLGLTLCGDNFVRAAFGLLFCLHAGCYPEGAHAGGRLQGPARGDRGAAALRPDLRPRGTLFLRAAGRGSLKRTDCNFFAAEGDTALLAGSVRGGAGRPAGPLYRRRVMHKREAEPKRPSFAPPFSQTF